MRQNSFLVDRILSGESPRTVLGEKLALKGGYKGSLFQRLAAALYKLAPRQEEEALPAFEELADKIERQHRLLGSKFRMVPTHQDPYRSQKHLSRDIEQQKTAGVRRPAVKAFAEPPGPERTSDEKGHPVFSDDLNTKLRWVHDLIAHHYGEHPFSARGEYGAYNTHLKTLCPDGRCPAAKALFTEVVGQTSYYYIYGDFPPQKAVIMPDFNHGVVGALSPGSPLNRFFVLKGKELLPRDDFDARRFASEHPELFRELQNQEKVRHSFELQPLSPA